MYRVNVIGWLITGICLQLFKREPEAASFTELALHPNGAALGFDKFFGNGESKPCSASFVISGYFKIPVEDFWQVFFIDPLAVIAYDEINRIAFLKYREFDIAFFRREFNGIGDEIDQHPGRFLRVGIDR